MAKGNGSFSQNFEARHELFLEEMAKGTSLEDIQKVLEISENQLMRHVTRAYREQQEEKAGYQTVPYKSLPQKIRNLFTVEEKDNPLVRITVAEGGSVILSIA